VAATPGAGKTGNTAAADAEIQAQAAASAPVLALISRLPLEDL
jgi:hypothetical protein